MKKILFKVLSVISPLLILALLGMMQGAWFDSEEFIGLEDAERVRKFQHPMCIGIEVNSRFETAPGMKDVNLLKRFIAEVRR